MNKDEFWRFKKNGEIKFGLKWDLTSQKVDLDATIVMIDELGEIVDAVYYNQLKSKCGAVKHSGDQSDGADAGYDEVLTVNLDKVAFSTCYLAVLITSSKG